MRSSSDSVGPGLSITFHCSPAVFRLSQGLVHTVSMAAHVWKENSKASAALLLTAHYILCNDTLDDIHFGQVATGEDILLPSSSCIGYAWRNHKADPQVWRDTDRLSFDCQIKNYRI